MGEYKDNISNVQKAAEERFELDVRGTVYNAVYAAITSTTGAAVLDAAGIITGGIPMAAALVFVTQIIPKLAKELDKRHSLNEARRSGYMAGRLETRKGTSNIFYKSMRGLGRASQF